MMARRALPIATSELRLVGPAIRTNAHVLGALMLRDMRTRVGGSHWGYVVAVGWPCAHIFTLVAILALRGFVAPLGDSVVLFIASGVVPYITFTYMSRKIMDGLALNKPLTYFPVVTILDVIVSRVVVEFVSACASAICVFLILEMIGVDALPIYPMELVSAFFATILVSTGMGVLNANIVVYFPGWTIGYILVIIAGYSTSGVFFLPDLLPQRLFDAMSWNPLLQCITWFRSAFYPGYGTAVSKLYTIIFGLGTILLGLLLERFVTRKRIQGF